MKVRKKYFKIVLFSIIILAQHFVLQSKGKIFLRKIGNVSTDTSRVILRLPPKEKIKEFRSDSDFSYNRENPPYLALWEDIIKWLKDKISAIFPSYEGSKVLDILIYILAGAALLFVVTRLIKTDLRGLFYKSKGETIPEISELIENIKEIDFDGLISRYMKLKEYRVLVRLLYHKTLKDLALRNMIEWKMDKTNNDYLKELEDSIIKMDFKELTRIFEYIWYGNFNLSEDIFMKVRDLFNGFNRSIVENK